MTSLRRSQTRISSFAFCLTSVAIAFMGCGHDTKTNNNKEEIPEAVGGNATAGTGSGSTVSNGGTAQTGNGGSSTTVTPTIGGAAPSGGAANGGAAPSEGGTAPTATGGDAPTVGGAPSSDAGAGGVAGGDSTPQGTAGAAAGGPSMLGAACESDVTCTRSGLLCNKALKQCAQCDKSSDCSDKSKPYCDPTGTCAPALPPGCKTNADCSNSTTGKACDVARGRCVTCVAATDCPASNECVNQACVPYTACTNSLNCATLAATPVCSTTLTLAKCVQCNEAADCEALGAGQVCAGNQCRAACTGTDCTDGLKCNTSAAPNFCAECATHSDCGADKFCTKGACVADVCKAGDQACVNNGIAVCSTDGDGFGTPTPCGTGLTCGVANSKAICGDGSPPVDCSVDPGKIDPCKSLPKFTLTQTVDGKGEDFCNIPSFELNFANAAATNNTKAERTAYTGKAVARVGWSEKFFHAYVEVTGSPVRSNGDPAYIWDGDSVELMITTSNTVTGLTSNDGNALHVQVNDQVAAIIKGKADSGTATAISDPTQYKGIKTSNGYAVELKMPWPNGAALAANTTVRFDMTINVDQASIDSNQGRDGQAVLAMANVSGTSTCSGTTPAPFCDDRLWCPTTLK